MAATRIFFSNAPIPSTSTYSTLSYTCRTDPASARLIKLVAENAHKEGIWCGICGELGADLELTETFLSIGVDELSVSPRAVLPLRQKVRETELGAVKQKLIDELMGD